MKYGGVAGFNSVSYASENFEVIAKRNGKGIKVEYDEYEENANNFNEFISKIPIVRGYWVIADTFIKSWKLSLIILGLIIVSMSLSQFTKVESSNVLTLNKNSLIIFAFSILIMFKITPIAKYHAAEHMVANAYDNKQKLNIKTVKNQSRIHESCGTNLAVFGVTIYFILNGLFYTPDLKGALIQTLAFPIAYEIFKVDNKIFKIITKPFYWIGYACQYLFFTSKPNDKHLEVALKSFKKLLTLEQSKLR